MTFALGTFSAAGSPTFPGLFLKNKVSALRALESLTTQLGFSFQAPATLSDLFEHWSENFAALQAAANAISNGASVSWLPLEQLRVHRPITPRQILCSGANYRKHVIDLIVDQGSGNLQHLSKEERLRHGTELMDHRAKHGKPFVFMALPTALAGPYDDLPLPANVKQPDWELELAVVIGKVARRVPLSQALDYVAGYTIANDITARDLADRPDIKGMGLDWMACKSAPGFKIVGPFITPAAFVDDPQRLHIRLKLNGKVMQDEGTSDMIFSVARLVEYISHHVQLLPGDLILTGSPSGNGTHFNRFLQADDVMDGEIDGLVGAQRVRCIGEA